MNSFDHDRKIDDDNPSLNEGSNQVMDEGRKITSHNSSSHCYQNYLLAPVMSLSQPPSESSSPLFNCDSFQIATSCHGEFSKIPELYIPPPFLQDPNSNIPTPQYFKCCGGDMKESNEDKESSLCSSDSSFYLEFSSPHLAQANGSHSRSIFKTSSLKISRSRSAHIHSREDHYGISKWCCFTSSVPNSVYKL